LERHRTDSLHDLWDGLSEGGATGGAEGEEEDEEFEEEKLEEFAKVEADEADRETGEAQDYLRRRSNVVRVQTAVDTYMQKASKLLRDQDPHLISQQIFSDVCKSRRRQFYGCLSLPFSIFCFGSFAYSVYLRGDITNVYMVESGLLGILSKGSGEVETIPALWNWLDGHLIPTVFRQTDDYGQVYKDKKMWSTVLGYNHLTGPLVLEQLRSEVRLCGSDRDSIGADMACYPMDSESREDFGRWDLNFNVTPPSIEDFVSAPIAGPIAGLPTVAQRLQYWQHAGQISEVSSSDNEGSGRLLRVMRPELRNKLQVQTTVTKAYSAYFFPSTRLALIQEHMKYIKRGHWLDEQTKQLRVRAMFLNAEMGRPRLTQFQLVFSISRAGGIFVRATCETLFLHFWADWYFYAADLVWILALSIVTVKYSRSLVIARHHGRLQMHMRSFSFLLNWLIILGGWCIFCFNVFQIVRTQTVVNAYREVLEAQNQDTPAEFISASGAGKSLQYEVDWMTYYNSWFRIFEAMYHLLLMIRFFIAFRTQPRLGVVISTLQASLIDVVHFLMVVLPMFAAYAISGCFIFGRRIEGFKSFESAAGTCFKIFMENQYDWQDLTEEHYWTAAIWTWSFMFLLVMLMLNMVLAIILDVYAEIRKNSGQSESVWVTFVNLISRIRYQKEWIPHKLLIEKSKSMSQMISREELLRTFPGMRNRQLNMLLLACRFRKEMAAQSNDGSFKDTMKMTKSVKLVADRMEELVRNLDEGTAAPDKQAPSVCSSNAGDDWMKEIAREMASQNHTMLSVQWQLQQLDWQVQAFEMMHRPREVNTRLQGNKRGAI